MAVLDASLIETFHRDGFVVVEDFFDFDELDLFGSIVDRAVKNRVGSDSRSVDEKSLYEQSFQQCMNLWEDNADLKEFTFDQKLGETAGLLLGAEALRIWHDQALYKEPGGRETDPHQDWPLWPMGPARQVTAWIPFDGSTLEAGAMGYSPGSHRLGLAKFSDITRELREEPYPYFDHSEMAEIFWVEAPRGSVVFHHSLTVHQARANVTTDTRRVYCIIYFEDGCTRSLPHWHQSLDRQGIEEGQQIQGPVTPVAWPRAHNDVPDPPSAMGGPPQTGFRY
ncbi:MAG: phytanoyl-CoA dioxygenase family protein [Acidimicrobiales bacterium]|nr:phytanoyl-CoA dioxygenase family protein [Acidimicrobiales bacterium]HJL99999.1 phytanoyl-CoA dioxygenase family protein [Acidimicrobiales bacterium]